MQTLRERGRKGGGRGRKGGGEGEGGRKRGREGAEGGREDKVLCEDPPNSDLLFSLLWLPAGLQADWRVVWRCGQEKRCLPVCPGFLKTR